MAEEKKKIKVAKPRINLALDKPVFSWESPEFVKYKRDNKWMVYLIMTAIVLCIIFGLMAQWSGVALVVVAAIVFITLSGAHPKSISSAIYTEGVIVDGKVYNFEQVKSFWVSYRDLPKIRLQLTGRFSGQIAMPLGEEDPEQLRLFLSKYLPEEEDKGEDLGDMINRIIRF